MEEIVQIGIFLGTIFLAIISGLLTWIGVMQRNKNENIELRIDRHDLKFEKQQEEIHMIAKTSEKQLAVMETTLQQHDKLFTELKKSWKK